MTDLTSSATATHDFHRTRHNLLSFSQVSDFLSCQYRWSLRYHRGLHPKKTARPLALGDAVHQAIAAGLTDQQRPEDTISDWYGKHAEKLTLNDNTSDEDWDQLSEIATTAPYLAERVLNEIRDMGWVPVMVNGRPSVEFDLTVPLPGFDGFIVHVDFLAYDRSSKLFRIVDFKVRRTFMPPQSEFTNLQHAIYHHVCRLYGIPVSGSVTYQIRNERPKWPKTNKNGSISKTAIATDWETYREAVLAAGQDPADYEDMRGKLADYALTDQQHSYRSPDELQRMWDTIVLPVAHAIRRERLLFGEDNTHEPVRNLKWFNCQTCQFREPCLQALAGYDVAPMLTSLFDSVDDAPDEEND